MTTAYVKNQRRVVLHKDYVRVVDGALERQTQWEDHPYPDLDLTPLYAEFLRRRGYVEDVSGTPSETPTPAPKPHYAEAAHRGGRRPLSDDARCTWAGCDQPRHVVASGRKRAYCPEHQKQYSHELWAKRQQAKKTGEAKGA